MKINLLFTELLLFFALLVSCSTKSVAQSAYTSEPPDSAVKYEDINVLVMVEKLGNFYLDILYVSDDQYYLQVEDLFKTLKIACFVSNKGDSISGFIDKEENPFVIDYIKGEIKAAGKTFQVPKGIIKESGSVFVESAIFPQAFGIELTYNPRSLTIALKANFELPILKQIRQEKIRTNLIKISGKQEADTVVKRSYHFLRGGFFDWAIGSSQNWRASTDLRIHLAAGFEFLYGETDLSLDYYNQQVITGDQFHYQWKWVDNEKKFFKQAQVGTISTQSIAFLNSTFIGATARNSPTTFRKASGYYTLQDVTEPDWIIELYINNILVDFTKSDASGLYVFKVPLVYGFTTLKLKFFGPMGEERMEERSINVPYTVMPQKEFEYGLTAGVLRNTRGDRFGRADFNYGLTRNLTFGAGIEYLSSISGSPFIPFAKITFQPFNRAMINAEYDHGIRAAFVFNFYFFKNVNMQLDYTKYISGQTAIPFKSQEERKGFLSVPFRIKGVNGYAKIEYQNLIFSFFASNQTNTSLSVYYRKFSVNSSTQVNWISNNDPYITSDLAFSLRLNRGYTLRASGQYNYTYNYIVAVKTEIEKRLDKGLISAYYENNPQSRINSVNISFRYDLPFARASVSVSNTDNNMVTSESIQGGIATGSGNKYVRTGFNAVVGKGGISVYPFLDKNNNEKFDPGERIVKLSSLKIMGNNIVLNDRDSVIRIPELNPFVYYLIEFSNNDLPNMTWRFVKKTYSVLIDPNQFKRIDIPVIAVGEINGMAMVNRRGVLRGTGRILVNIYSKQDNKLITQVLTESDGYIYYMGLLPGEYIARIDRGQMDRLGLDAVPKEIPFSVKFSEDGDIIEGIDFTLGEK